MKNTQPLSDQHASLFGMRRVLFSLNFWKKYKQMEATQKNWKD